MKLMGLVLDAICLLLTLNPFFDYEQNKMSNNSRSAKMACQARPSSEVLCDNHQTKVLLQLLEEYESEDGLGDEANRCRNETLDTNQGVIKELW